MPPILIASADAALICDRLIVDGYRVFAARNAEEALEALRSARFDCVILDFSVAGLVEEFLTRAELRSATVYSSPDLYVNFRTAEVKRDEQRIALTALEMHMLQYLIEHRGEVISREELLDTVWGYGTSPVTRTVDVRIASLRRKLGNSELIVTVHGFGYKFAG